MGIFGTKEKNYENEIALLNERQNELSEITDKNKSDVVALGIDFSEYKETIGNQFNEVWDFIKSLNSDLSEFKKWKEEQKQEMKSTKKAKTELPNTLTYKEVCDALVDFSYLTQTSFKYFLYENGILDLKINRIHNTYKISNEFNNSTSELKKYICITDGALTFDNSILDYLVNNPEGLQESIYRYVRKQKQFSESKQHLSEVEIKNFQSEIGKICGTLDSYDKDKWASIYNRYEKDHPNYRKQYDSFSESYMIEHPNAKYKPSIIKYLVQEVGDGDVLLKIACELFID